MFGLRSCAMNFKILHKTLTRPELSYSRFNLIKIKACIMFVTFD